MDVAQPEEGGGESSGTPTLPGQSASVISRPAEERVKVTPQAKVPGRPPVAIVTSRQQDQGRIPVAGGHSKGKCLKKCVNIVLPWQLMYLYQQQFNRSSKWGW